MNEAVDTVDANASSTTLSLPAQRCLVAQHLQERVEVLSGRLDFAVLPAVIYAQVIELKDAPPETSSTLSRSVESQSEHENTTFFTVDEHLVYARFFADFGPLDLAQTVRFGVDTNARLASALPATRLLLLSSDHPHKRANAMTLLALYLVMHHGRSPAQALRPFRSLTPPFGFRDAACGPCSFLLSILDCTRAVHKVKTALCSLFFALCSLLV
ncbi:hypothetical protein PINS_up012856 [Pythium insidiosum]|nr:hypothetical protein PINS_up012856 [Pythium insidiosum]